MTDGRNGSLPVVRDGQLVGVITESEMFKPFQKLLGARKRGARIEEAVRCSR